jgi:ABC-type transport system involved in multi-copper enzyme maturation permease subunit
MNPVLARETRERFRSRRVSLFVSLWLLGMGAITYVVYLLAQVIARDTFSLGRLVAAGYQGRFVFQASVLVLITSVVMVVPGATATSIVGERERQTLHLLQVSQMTPFQIVMGKLQASLAYLVWLVVAALPLVALPLVFGGVSLGDVAAGLGMLLATALVLGSISMWVSARAKSARGAVAASYALAIALAFLTFVPMTAELLITANSNSGLFQRGGGELYSVLINPYFGTVSAIEAPLEVRQDPSGQATPFVPFELVLFGRQGADVFGAFSSMAPGTIEEVDGRQLVNYQRPPLWLYTLAFDLALSAVMLWRASEAVRAPAARQLELTRNRHANS